MAAIAWPLKEKRSIPHKKVIFLSAFMLLYLCYLKIKHGASWYIFWNCLNITFSFLHQLFVDDDCSEFVKCSTVKKSADHLMPDCLQKAFDFNVFRDMHHFSRDNRSLESCRFTLFQDHAHSQLIIYLKIWSDDIYSKWYT